MDQRETGKDARGNIFSLLLVLVLALLVLLLLVLLLVLVLGLIFLFHLISRLDPSLA